MKASAYHLVSLFLLRCSKSPRHPLSVTSQGRSGLTVPDVMLPEGRGGFIPGP